MIGSFNNKKSMIMTVDLEGDLDTKNTVSLEKVVPRLLDLFEARNIKATFFVVSELLQTHLELIKEIEKRGHEIASHSKTHTFLNSKNSLKEMQESKKEFEKYGFEVKGFRAPSYITANSHFEDLKKAGYQYDASFAVFWPGRYRNLWLGFKPKPYVQTMKGSSGEEIKILELPTPTFIWPCINSGLSYLKLFYPLSKLFPFQYMFYLHPWEFLDYEDLPETKKGIVGKLLTRNSGERAWQIFEEFLDWCEGNGVEWVSCEENIILSKFLD